MWIRFRQSRRHRGGLTHVDEQSNSPKRATSQFDLISGRHLGVTVAMFRTAPWSRGFLRGLMGFVWRAKSTGGESPHKWEPLGNLTWSKLGSQDLAL